jgi:hypothetical protein
MVSRERQPADEHEARTPEMMRTAKATLFDFMIFPPYEILLEAFLY